VSRQHVRTFLTVATLLPCGCDRMGDRPPWWPPDERSAEPPPQPKPVDQALFCPPPADATANPAPTLVPRDPAAIQSAVRRHYDPFRVCYEGALSRNRAAHGRVAIRFTIRPDGRVESPCLVQATLRDDEAVRCVLNEFQKVTFEPADGPTRVVYPIMLEPGPEDGASP
jgi:hypothetical protein